MDCGWDQDAPPSAGSNLCAIAANACGITYFEDYQMGRGWGWRSSSRASRTLDLREGTAAGEGQGRDSFIMHISRLRKASSCNPTARAQGLVLHSSARENEGDREHDEKRNKTIDNLSQPTIVNLE